VVCVGLVLAGVGHVIGFALGSALGFVLAGVGPVLISVNHFRLLI